MPLVSRFARLVTLLLAVCVVAFGFVPTASAATTSGRHGHAVRSLDGDTASTSSARRASYAWSGRAILYTESIPSKWDWSLNTAIAKWNATGGGIKFVRTTNVRKARLNIAYGNIGDAAGEASVGKVKHAFVRLSSVYDGADALDAHNRIEVMEIFAHELGHVLGFEHTSAKCSLMSPVLDVEGCGTLSPSKPGYYECRTIDAALAARFVKLYGGHAVFPSTWCPIDPLPSAANRVSVTAGQDESLTVRWAKPAYAPAGSSILVRSWAAQTCGAVPTTADIAYAPVGAGVWHDTETAPVGSSCVSVQLVNRYGAGRTAVLRLMRF